MSLRRYCDFEDAVSLVGEELVGLFDLFEIEAMGNDRGDIKTLRGDEVHQPSHPFLAAGAKGSKEVTSL